MDKFNGNYIHGNFNTPNVSAADCYVHQCYGVHFLSACPASRFKMTFKGCCLCQSIAIDFQRIWWINKFGGLTGYSLVLVHYIGTGNCGGLKGLADKAVTD